MYTSSFACDLLMTNVVPVISLTARRGGGVRAASEESVYHRHSRGVALAREHGPPLEAQRVQGHSGGRGNMQRHPASYPHPYSGSRVFITRPQHSPDSPAWLVSANDDGALR